MKHLLVLLAATLLAVYACSCGSSSKTASSTNAASTGTAKAAKMPPAPVETAVDEDKDNDVGSVGEDKENLRIPSFGHPASASEKQAITALIKRYYAAALAENGAEACSLILSTLAEAIPEDYSGEPGVSYMQGAKTCSEAMTLLYKHNHPQLALEVPKLSVALVRLEGHHGLAKLKFGNLPERETSFAREGNLWKMTTLLDNQLE